MGAQAMGFVELLRRLGGLALVWGERAMVRIFPRLPFYVRMASWRIHYSYYAAFGFAAILISAAASAALALSGILPPLVLAAPALVLFAVLAAPVASYASRSYYVASELPYAGIYLGSSASAGLDLYTAVQRVRDSGLFPNIAPMASVAEFYHKVAGYEAAAALEKASTSIPSEDLRELFSGYASTLSSGGSVARYMASKVEAILESSASRVRSSMNMLASLAEIYLAISVASFITIFVMFATSRFFSPSQPLVSESVFYAVTFALMPMVSAFFIYASEVLMRAEPYRGYGQYALLAISVPVSAILAMAAILGPEGALAPVAGLLESLSKGLSGFLGAPQDLWGFYAVGILVLIPAAPTAIADLRISIEEARLVRGFQQFLREYIEARRAGIHPEKILEILGRRDYGPFTRVLRVSAPLVTMSSSPEPLSHALSKILRSWEVRATVFIALDMVRIGGGSVEALEQLLRHIERVQSIRREARAYLRPLLMLPFIGGYIMAFTTLLVLNMASLGKALAEGLVLSTPSPAAAGLGASAAFVTFLTAMTIGKMVEGRLSSGIRHGSCVMALLLATLPLISIFAKSVMGAWG